MNGRALQRSARAWGRRQLYSLFSSLGSLVQHPLGTLMTVVVLGIAMALPAGLHVALSNLRGVDLREEAWAAITVFLQAGTTEPQAVLLLEKLRAREDADGVLVSPEEGMREFREASGLGPAIDLLESNPLPWLLQVRPRPMPGKELGTTVNNLGQWLAEQERVESVSVDHKWLQRLDALLRLGTALVGVLGSMFALAVVVVVANTIRLDVASRAREIEVLNLVGAGDGFIRQPFLYAGLWYGAMGALVALVILEAALNQLRGPLATLVDAYGNAYRLSGLGIGRMALVVLSGGGLGLLGAWVSVERYLHQLRRGERLFGV